MYPHEIGELRDRPGDLRPVGLAHRLVGESVEIEYR